MAKSMIIYGVPGGKTRFAQRIADHFGLCLVVQNFSGFPLCKASTLFISDATSVPSNYAKISRSFQSVADEINSAIPLTDWQSGPPPMVGEWNADMKIDEDSFIRRWWDGRQWSFAYDVYDSHTRRCWTAEWKTDLAGEMYWRGLSSEPIKVTE